VGSYLVIGIIYGCLYALTATALVVTYTTSGIFNFAVGAMGMFMAFAYWQLAVAWGVPWPLALLIVVFVAAPVMGAVIERVVRPLHGAALGITLVVTLGIMLELLYVADAIWKPTSTRNLPTILPGDFRVFGVVVEYYDVMVVAVSVGVAVLLRVFFTRSRAGITMRAVVDDRELTARSGASPARTAQLSWMLGSVLAALAGILIAGGNPPLQHLDEFNLTVLVISGFAAAVAGRLKSLQLTVAGAMLLGLLTAFGIGYLPINWLSNLEPVIPMALLFVVLLVLPEERLRAARFGTRTHRRVTGLGPSIALGALFVAGCWVVSLVLSAGNLLTFGHGLVVGIILLSLVLLTGYGGQVSLCQMTLAGFGAYFMGKTFGGSSPVGLLAAFALPAAVGAVLALAVLRLRGIYLALATLAFAYAMDNLFFNRELGFGGVLKVGRVGVHSQRAFLLEVAVLFVVCAIGVLALRRGEFGRRLAAVNDSEVACASIGMNITLTKVLAFTVAAGIAGLGGALYGGWQGAVGPTDFQMLVSLIVLLLIAISGLDTVAGAFVAAILVALQSVVDNHAPFVNFSGMLVGLGAVSLGRNPSGVVGQVSDALGMVRSVLGRRSRGLAGVADARLAESEEVGLAGAGSISA
jgi:branched-chain amino acid transport system permease protein